MLKTIKSKKGLIASKQTICQKRLSAFFSVKLCCSSLLERILVFSLNDDFDINIKWLEVTSLSDSQHCLTFIFLDFSNLIRMSYGKVVFCNFFFSQLNVHLTDEIVNSKHMGNWQWPWWLEVFKTYHKKFRYKFK